MGYYEQMEDCRRYILSHLEEEPTAVALAQRAGYSLYHFCRVFKAFYGVSVGTFMRREKLNRAAADLLTGESVLNVALSYGYDTHAGFVKAFEKQFGCSPSAYRKNKGVKIMSLKVTIQNQNEFKVFGYIIETADESQGGYWEKVNFSDYPSYPEDCDDQGEVAMWIHPAEVSGELKYFFGYKTEDKSPAKGFEEIIIPAAQYAMFEFENGESAQELSQRLAAAWKEIFAEWFESVEYQYDESKMCFEFYKDDKSFIYVPVK